MEFTGPAIVEDPSTTVVIFPKQKCKVDKFANLHISLGEKVNSIKNDPITTEIIQSSLQAACDEMFVAMRKLQ